MQYLYYNFKHVDVQSFTGQKLIRRGDFHVGSQVKTMFMMPQRGVTRQVTRRDVDGDSYMAEDDGDTIKKLCLYGNIR